MTEANNYKSIFKTFWTMNHISHSFTWWNCDLTSHDKCTIFTFFDKPLYPAGEAQNLHLQNLTELEEKNKYLLRYYRKQGINQWLVESSTVKTIQLVFCMTIGMTIQLVFGMGNHYDSGIRKHQRKLPPTVQGKSSQVSVSTEIQRILEWSNVTNV